MERNKIHIYNKIPYTSGLQVYCPNCGFKKTPNYRLGGCRWLQIVLLILGIIPGILYYIRRNMNCVCVCRNCRKEKLGEINGVDELIKKLKKITCIQNICYILLVFCFFLFVGYELYLTYNNIS